MLSYLEVRKEKENYGIGFRGFNAKNKVRVMHLEVKMQHAMYA